MQSLGAMPPLPMHEEVRLDVPDNPSPRRLPSLAGRGLPERMRSTVVAFMGLTAAAGLALVAIFAQLGFPLLSPAPLPDSPPQANAVAEAEVVSVDRGVATAVPAPRAGGDSGGPGAGSASTTGSSPRDPGDNVAAPVDPPASAGSGGIDAPAGTGGDTASSPAAPAPAPQSVPSSPPAPTPAPEPPESPAPAAPSKPEATPPPPVAPVPAAAPGNSSSGAAAAHASERGIEASSNGKALGHDK